MADGGMRMRLGGVIVALALLAGGAWWWLRTDEPAPASGAPAEAHEVALERAGPPPSLAARPVGVPAKGAASPDATGDAARDEAADGEPAAGADTAAGPRVHLEGVVRDEAGAPVAGARVRVMEGEGRGLAVMPPVETGADGRFRIAGIRERQPYMVEAQSPRHPMARVGPVQAEPGKDLLVEVRLEAGRFLDVVVRDAETAAPIAGASVGAVGERIPLPGEAAPEDPVSDPAGRVRIGPLTPLEVDVSVRAEGFLRARRTVPAGADPTLEVNLVRALTLSGRVLRPDGSPAVGAEVKLRMGPDAFRLLHSVGWLSASTDERGAFTFAGLPTGRVPLEAHLRPAAPEEGQVLAEETGAADPEAGTSDCVIHLNAPGASRAGVLTIRVLDAAGVPVPRATIQIASRGWSMGTGLSDGVFRFERPPDRGEATWTVSVSSARDAAGAALPLASTSVEVPSGASELTIRLERSDPVRGVVRGPDGAPVQGARVVLSRRSEEGVAQVVASETTAQDGTFALFGVGPGRASLSVEVVGEFLASAPVEVEAGAADLEVRLRRGASVVVTVLDPEGAPLSGAEVGRTAADEGESAWGGRFGGEPDRIPSARLTDASGRATLVGLDPAGRYFLAVRSRREGILDFGQERWIPADTTIRLRRSHRITGVVRDPSGRPVASARVEAIDGDGASNGYAVDGAGRFQLRGLPPGPVRLRAVPFVAGSEEPPEPPGPPLPSSDGAPAAVPGAEPWVLVQAGAIDVVLTLDLGATLLVRVEGWSPEAAGATPYQRDGFAYLEPEGAPAAGRVAVAAVADDGTIRFHRLDPARTYTLWVAPAGDRSLRRSGVRAGQDLRVRLEPGKTLSLRVVGPSPRSEAQLSLVGCPLPVSGWRTVKDDGTADLVGFPPGRYTVVAAYTVEGQALAGTVVVEAGGPRVDLVVAPAAPEGR